MRIIGIPSNDSAEHFPKLASDAFSPAEIQNDEPYSSLSWRSLPRGAVRWRVKAISAIKLLKNGNDIRQGRPDRGR